MNPKPLVALNHFTVPMLTGVVPSQDRYTSSPLSDGLVRSNFWKGRQRLNRLYRWIANVVRPKIDTVILFQSSPQNNPEVHDFLIAPRSAIGGLLPAHRHDFVTRFSRLDAGPSVPIESEPRLFDAVPHANRYPPRYR